MIWLRSGKIRWLVVRRFVVSVASVMDEVFFSREEVVLPALYI